MDKYISSIRKNRIISVSLVVLLILSLFSLVGSSSKENPRPTKQIFAMTDTGGADIPGSWSGGCIEDYELNKFLEYLRPRGYVDENDNILNFDELSIKFGGFKALDIILNDYNYRQYNTYLLKKQAHKDNPSVFPDPICKHSDNPKLFIEKCASPDLTVALLIDRSSSVVKAGGQDQYKLAMQHLVDEFYKRVSPTFTTGGKLNFLIYAFASKSVLQNETTDGSPIPVIGNNVLTSVSNDAQLINMKNIIQNIHFRDDDAFANKNIDSDGFQYGSGFDNFGPKAKARSYNAGSQDIYGIYGQTNWHDAFVSVIDGQVKLQAQGKKIDMAVMVTDGDPSLDDGEDWKWNNTAPFMGDNITTYNDNVDRTNGNRVKDWNDLYNGRGSADLYKITTLSAGRGYGVQVTDALRSGDARKGYAKRDGIPLRGILISPNIFNDSAYYLRQTMQYVFRESNYEVGKTSDKYYYFATSFNKELTDQIDLMVFDIFEAANCNLNHIETGLVLKEESGQELPEKGGVPYLEVNEGDTGYIDLTAINISKVISGSGSTGLKDVYYCIKELNTPVSGEKGITNYDDCKLQGKIVKLSLAQNESTNFQHPVYVDWGQGGQDSYLYITVIGQSLAGSTDVSSSYPVSNAIMVHLKKIPAAFPA